MNKSRLRLGQKVLCRRYNMSHEPVEEWTINCIDDNANGGFIQLVQIEEDGKCRKWVRIHFGTDHFNACEFLPTEEDNAIDALLATATDLIYCNADLDELQIAIDTVVEKVRDG